MTADPDDVVAAAIAWLGTPYRHQAATLGAGCDCLGLVRGVWRALYGAEPWTVPPYAQGWRGGPGLDEAAAKYLLPVAEPAAGAVVLFRLSRTAPPRHCGIMLAPDRFLHAQERLGVVAADLTEGWAKRMSGIFAFPART